MILREILENNVGESWTVRVVILGTFNGRMRTIAKGKKGDHDFKINVFQYLGRLVAGAKWEMELNTDEDVYLISIF